MPFKILSGLRKSHTSKMPEKEAFAATKLKLKYFELGPIAGRGGVVRFMLFVHDLDFEDVKVAPDDSWLELKQELVTSGHNPCGTIPVLYIDDTPYFGHIPILKYMAAKLDADSSDPEVIYRSNVMLDEYTNWRNDWSDSLFDEEKKKAYTEKRETIYALIEKLYERRLDKSGPYFMGLEKPGYDDLCVFTMVQDDFNMCGEMNLDAYPTVKAMCEKVKAIPRIAAWYTEKQAAAAAAAEK